MTTNIPDPETQRAEEVRPQDLGWIAGCVFCMIAGKMGETRRVVDFEPLNPVTPGHRLFVPNRHVADAAEDATVTGYTFEAAARWAAEQGVPFNLITSAGAEATQTVFHLHIHYVPRADSDELPLPWTPQHEAARRKDLPCTCGDAFAANQWYHLPECPRAVLDRTAHDTVLAQLAEVWDAGAKAAGGYGHEDDWTQDFNPFLDNPYERSTHV